MDVSQAVQTLSALAHEMRLKAFRTLVAEREMAAGELAGVLGVLPSTLSFHLKDLRVAGLVETRREGRQIMYRASPEAFGALLAFLGDDCCHGRPELCLPPRPGAVTLEEQDVMAQHPGTDTWSVLFLCTGNSARSIMAEAILNRIGNGRFRAYSAGSAPRGSIHPGTLRVLQNVGLETDGLRSKSWKEFMAADAPRLDFVFTVCDDAANEVCPVWPGEPVTAHWGVPDPVAAEGDEKTRALAFGDAYRMLANRISIFTSLPFAALDRLTLQNRLDDIGMTGSPHAAGAGSGQVPEHTEELR